MKKKKQEQKKKLAIRIGVFFATLFIGISVGYTLFEANKRASKEAPLMIETNDGDGNPEEEIIGEAPIEKTDSRSDDERREEEYEGSDAEQSVVREISAEEEAQLKNEIGEKGFVNRAYGYAFIPPEGWFADQINSDISQFVTYTSVNPAEISSVPENEGLLLEVVVQGNTKNQTLDEWVEDGHGYMKPINSEKVQINGHDAYKELVEYEGKMGLVTIVKGQDVYTFSMTGKDFESQTEVFERFVQSIIIL